MRPHGLLRFWNAFLLQQVVPQPYGPAHLYRWYLAAGHPVGVAIVVVYTAKGTQDGASSRSDRPLPELRVRIHQSTFERGVRAAGHYHCSIDRQGHSVEMKVCPQ